MKTTVLAIGCVLLLTVGVAFGKGEGAAFSTCDTENFSFKDLEYYEKNELIEGYCKCTRLASLNGEMAVLAIKLKIAGGVPETSEGTYNKQATTATSNADRILRVLSKKYNYKGTPKCPERKTE
jgi:hypothetical protein